MKMILLRSLALLAFILQQQSKLAIAEKDNVEPCILRVGQRIRNLQQQQNEHDHSIFVESSERKHRRAVSVDLPTNCDQCDVINVDHDGVTMSFNKVKSTSSEESATAALSPDATAFVHWSGKEADNGSFFNLVQDADGGHLAGSLVDVSSHTVLQFHSTHDGEYAVTITPSSDFPPEDDPLESEDGPMGIAVGERKLEMKNTKDDKKNTPTTFLSTNAQWNPTAASSKVGPLKSNLSKQAGRNLYNDLGGNLDVMVVWTRKSECALSSLPNDCTLTSTTESNMRALIELAVSETNDAYANSGINTELLLVHAYRHSTYVETSFSQSLDDITVGNLSGVHFDRFTHGADLVALIIDDAQYCGLAWIGPHIDLMYSVTAWNCATGYYSFGHEIAHNLGCYHDRGTQNTCTDSRYSFGWRDPNANFRTVLSYNCATGQCDNNAGGGCSRVPYYSNPNTVYNDQAVGDANNDNARQINDVKETVAAYNSHGFNTLAPVSITPAPVVPPSPAVCGDGDCQVMYGEGCGSCSSDCFLPTNCNSVVGAAYQAYINQNVYGMVFDIIVGSRDLYFYEIFGYTSQSTTAKVYMKIGSHVSDSNLLNWRKVFDGTVTPTVASGSNNRAIMDFSSSRFYAPAGTTVAVYISYGLGAAIWYGGTFSFSNTDVSVQKSNLLRQQLSNTLPLSLASGWSFLDTIRYDYGPEPTASPTKAPAPLSTPAPNKFPTASPTITNAGKNEWDIFNDGVATDEVTTKDTILITIPFTSSNRDKGALVFKEDCITPFDSDTYFVIDTTAPTSTAPDGTVNFNTTLAMNITAINGTQYWNAFTDGTRGGWVEFCVETYLSSTDNLDLGNDDDVVEKIDFKNNVLNISVSLTATYEVDEVRVIRDEAVREGVNTDYSEFIVAYECNESNPYVKAVNTYNQGDEITICVTDESNGIVQVEKFVNLVVAQDGINDYNFILNTLYNPDITTPVCLDATAPQRRVCHAKIRALARFFQSASPVDLTIKGSVYVIRDGRRLRRNLHMALPYSKNKGEAVSLGVIGRRVEEEDKEKNGEFIVKVSLASADDSAAPGHIVGSGAAYLMSMTLGAAGAALMV